MAVEASFVIRCDLCGELLYTQSGDLIRCHTRPGIQRAAEDNGWEQINPRDDHINPLLQCRACINRQRAMHAWIKQNRVIDHAE